MLDDQRLLLEHDHHAITLVVLVLLLVFKEGPELVGAQGWLMVLIVLMVAILLLFSLLRLQSIIGFPSSSLRICRSTTSDDLVNADLHFWIKLNRINLTLLGHLLHGLLYTAPDTIE